MDLSRKRQAYERMVVGMIQKDRALLESAMTSDSLLYHMTGRAETREEYIRDILDGTLNYFDYEILSFTGDEATVRLLAKVYGGGKSWWTLKMRAEYAVEDGETKIKTCKVRMG